MVNAINNIYVNFSFKTKIMHFTHLLISFPLNEFNIDFRCIGKWNHWHGPAGLQAGIKIFNNTVRSCWATNWLFINSFCVQYQYYPAGLQIGMPL